MLHFALMLRPPKNRPVASLAAPLNQRRGALPAVVLAIALLVPSSVPRAQDSLGSYKFDLDGRSLEIPSLRERARGKKHKPGQELISLRGTAEALGIALKPAGEPGSFVMEIAGSIVRFSGEYPSIVWSGDRVVSLSRDARRIGADLYLPPDFLSRVVLPLLRGGGAGPDPAGG